MIMNYFDAPLRKNTKMAKFIRKHESTENWLKNQHLGYRKIEI